MQLSLAIVAEGRSDIDFFRPLLGRTVRDLGASSDRSIDVGGILPIQVRVALGEKYVTALARAVEESSNAFHILLFHVDGGSDSESVRSGRVAAADVAVRATLGKRSLVAVVPVREMEAWALADGDAIRSVIGTSRSNMELGLPRRPADAEAVPDPKAMLDSVVGRAPSNTRRRRRAGADFLARIAETADLDELRRVPSFARYEQDLTSAMRDAGFL